MYITLCSVNTKEFQLRMRAKLGRERKIFSFQSRLDTISSVTSNLRSVHIYILPAIVYFIIVSDDAAHDQSIECFQPLTKFQHLFTYSAQRFNRDHEKRGVLILYTFVIINRFNRSRW